MKLLAGCLIVACIALCSNAHVLVNTSCVYFQSDISFQAEYENNVSRVAISNVFSYNSSDEGFKIETSCNESEPTNSSTVTIMTKYTTLTLVFTLDDNNNTMLETVTLDYSLNDTATFPHANSSVTDYVAENNDTEFNMGPPALFLCNSTNLLDLTTADFGTANLTLEGIQAQIFDYTDTDAISDKRYECEADKGLPYYVEDAKSNPCLVMTDFTGHFFISYEQKDGKKANTTLKVPTILDSYFGGSCSSAANTFSMSWSTQADADVSARTNQLMLMFAEGSAGPEGNKLTYLKSATLFWQYGDKALFTNPKVAGAGSATISSTSLLGTTSDYYYSCSKPQDLMMTSKNGTTVGLTLNSIAVDVFRTATNRSLTGMEYNCAAPVADNTFSVMKNGDICLLLNMKASFMVPYYNTKTKMEATANVTIPAAADVVVSPSSSTCMNSTDTLALFYGRNEYSFHFTRSDESFQLGNITLTVDRSDGVIFQNTNDTSLLKRTFTPPSGSLSASTSGYYKCDTAQTIDLSDGFSLSLSNVKVQAFRSGSGNSTEFTGDMSDCTGDKDKVTDNTVPIVVGACLAALVLLVVIAYFIGRKRSRKGYQQV